VTRDALFRQAGVLAVVAGARDGGGTLPDLAADRAHWLVPLSDADAEEMLGVFRAGARLLDPGRSPALDRRAGVDVIVRVGRVAEQLPEVVELDLNLLVVVPDGCVVVDARIRVAPVSAADPRAPDARLLIGDLTINSEPTVSNVRRMRGEQHW
jgi:hypothetical protein